MKEHYHESQGRPAQLGNELLTPNSTTIVCHRYVRKDITMPKNFVDVFRGFLGPPFVLAGCRETIELVQ